MLVDYIDNMGFPFPSFPLSFVATNTAREECVCLAGENPARNTPAKQEFHLLFICFSLSHRLARGAVSSSPWGPYRPCLVYLFWVSELLTTGIGRIIFMLDDYGKTKESPLPKIGPSPKRQVTPVLKEFPIPTVVNLASRVPGLTGEILQAW